jgi:hypothetical protein
MGREDLQADAAGVGVGAGHGFAAPWVGGPGTPSVPRDDRREGQRCTFPADGSETDIVTNIDDL